MKTKGERLGWDEYQPNMGEEERKRLMELVKNSKVSDPGDDNEVQKFVNANKKTHKIIE